MLEVVRHVNIGHDLVRPTTERISGHRLIASYFKSNPDHEPLARSALKLMQSAAGDSSPSYSAVGAEWIRGSIPPPALSEPREPPHGFASAGLEARVAELNAHITALVVLQEGLLVRLARLEARVGGGASPALQAPEPPHVAPAPRAAPAALAAPRAGVEPASESPAAAASAPPPSADEPEPVAVPGAPEAPPLREAPGVRFLEANPSRPPAPRLSMPGPAPAVDQRARPRAELELPPLAELAKSMELLMSGNDVVVQEGEELSVTPELADCYAAALEDDSGEQVGLILMDLRATVFLGGTLMLQPNEQLEQQFAAASPEQDSIAAAVEVCNVLSGAVNTSQNRYRVRTSGLARFALDQFDWAPTPASRRDLKDSFGGRTAVLSRPTA